MSSSNNLIVNNSRPFLGKLIIPGDKSISHRSIILGSIAKGKLIITNFLKSDDCLHTISAMRNLGAKITDHKEQIMIEGIGLNNIKKPKNIIDAGNSGTLIRLLSGLLSTQNFTSKITGDESLTSRPMKRIIEPLALNTATGMEPGNNSIVLDAEWPYASIGLPSISVRVDSPSLRV